MKAKSTVKPTGPYALEERGIQADILFFTNIEETAMPQGDRGYEYDAYRLTVPLRDTLAAELAENWPSWLEAARQQEAEALAAGIRAKRDRLLAESDSRLCLDRLGLTVPQSGDVTAWLAFLRALGDALGGSWVKYRQALRELPQQAGFPYEVRFPAPPEDLP